MMFTFWDKLKSKYVTSPVHRLNACVVLYDDKCTKQYVEKDGQRQFTYHEAYVAYILNCSKLLVRAELGTSTPMLTTTIEELDKIFKSIEKIK